jgi:hypothetical protein
MLFCRIPKLLMNCKLILFKILSFKIRIKMKLNKYPQNGFNITYVDARTPITLTPYFYGLSITSFRRTEISTKAH